MFKFFREHEIWRIFYIFFCSESLLGLKLTVDFNFHSHLEQLKSISQVIFFIEIDRIIIGSKKCNTDSKGGRGRAVILLSGGGYTPIIAH